MILSTFLAVRESESAFCWRLIAFSRMAGATIGAELFLAVVPLAVEATSAIVVAPAAAASLAQVTAPTAAVGAIGPATASTLITNAPAFVGSVWFAAFHRRCEGVEAGSKCRVFCLVGRYDGLAGLFLSAETHKKLGVGIEISLVIHSRCTRDAVVERGAEVAFHSRDKFGA